MSLWGSDSRVKYVTRTVKAYGRDYYAQRNKDGIVCVFRKNKRYVTGLVTDEAYILTLIDSPEFVFALTDNWRTNGVPREYGSELILKKLKESDLWMNPELIEEMDRQNEKIDAIRKKDKRNEMEAYLSDNHSAFKKAFSDINTANLSKRERRKELQDKKIRRY